MSSLHKNYEDSLTKTFERSILRNAYVWMSLALAITAVVAYYNLVNPQFLQQIQRGGSMAFFGLAILQIGLVLFLTARLKHLSAPVAIFAFLLYASTMGIIVAFYGAIYGVQTLFKAFAVTSIMFGGSSVVGYTTKKDLTSMGHYVGMAIWGLLAALMINFFMRSPMVDYFISIAGVVIFTLLTAYDTQKIKALSDQASSNATEADYIRYSIMGALTIYLDFINMFLYLVRIFGRRN